MPPHRRSAKPVPPQPSGSPSWPAQIDSLPLDGVAQGGEATGRYGGGQGQGGRVVFVRGALPGEVVSVRLSETRRSYARGVATEIVRPSPDRVVPRCPLFGRCGGCHWQYAAYPAQLRMKRQVVVDQCRHLGGFDSPPVDSALGMDNPWAYRSTTTLHVPPEGGAGYYAWHSHQVVPLAQCPLLVPALNELLPPLQQALQRLPASERPRRVTLRYSWADQDTLLLLEDPSRQGALRLNGLLSGCACSILWQQGRHSRTLAGRGFLWETLGDTRLRISPTSFFQVNLPQAQRLLQQVMALLVPMPQDHLLDAYAGVGALSLPMAHRIGRLTAIEADSGAVADLRHNMAQLRSPQQLPLVALRGTVEQVLPTLETPLDLVLLDPPRRGCHPEALAAVVQHHPRRIVYVSCHPGTLARDLRHLCSEGYRLVQIVPVDLFPQTFHIESVTLLERGEHAEG